MCLCLVLALNIVPHHGHLRYLRDTGYVMGGLVMVGAALLALAKIDGMLIDRHEHAGKDGVPLVIKVIGGNASMDDL